MLEYNSFLDQYTEVTFPEFSESSDEEPENKNKTIAKNRVLVLKKKSKISKSRCSFINYFNLARIIRKSGRLNIYLTKLPHKHISYIRDLGNTLLTIRWRWILTTLVLVNFICFLVFGVLWWVLALHSGDFDKNNTKACVVNANTLTGYMLLSVETIMTIGYGYRYPTEACKGGWVLLVLQALFSVAIEGALISIVYVKISKPFSYMSTSLFSKTAVICLRDGKLRFVFRINDFYSKVWCATNISLYFIDKEEAHQGAEYKMTQMEVEPHGLLIFPLEIEHVIDENSPLWTFRPMDILEARFEIIAVAEGSSNITGQISQNRTSFSNADIYWGHRFKPCVEYDETKEIYIVDYKKFKQIVPFDTPLCSAKKLQDIQRRVEEAERRE